MYFPLKSINRLVGFKLTHIDRVFWSKEDSSKFVAGDLMRGIVQKKRADYKKKKRTRKARNSRK